MLTLKRIWAAVALATVPLSASYAAGPAECNNPNALGVARTVEIDTTGGPGFGFEHYKANDFLQQKEVVLTFDDGPQKFSTEMVLAALAEQCTKATFFSIGKMALGYPEILREVAKAGHTIGSHTWSHQAVNKLKTFDEWRDEMERGLSGVKRAVGGPVAPFFRYPTLKDSPESLAYLGKRNIAMFSTDVDSFDFKPQSPESIVKTVMAKLDKTGKGIVLMHDIHKTTAKALPLLLTTLKEKGYKIVHLTAKTPVATVAEYDAAIEKDAKGLPQVGTERPVSSIVRTVGGEVPAAETQKPEAASAPVAAGAVQTPAAPAPKVEAKVETAPAPQPQPKAKLEPTTVKPEEGSPHADAVKPEQPITIGSINNDGSAGTATTAPKASDPTGNAGEKTVAPVKGYMARAIEVWHEWFGK